MPSCRLLYEHPTMLAVEVHGRAEPRIAVVSRGAKEQLGWTVGLSVFDLFGPELRHAWEADALASIELPSVAARDRLGTWIAFRVRVAREDERAALLLEPVDVVAEGVRRGLLTEQRHALVLEGTRLGMWDWNPQTDDVVFDDRWAEMLGHTLEEIPFTIDSWSSRVHPDDLAKVFEDVGDHMSGRTAFYENVHRMRHKDGSWRYILDRGRIVERDAEGRPTRFTGTHTDITPQMKAEQEARDRMRARTRFLAAMSHEIRTPLHGMLGLAELVDATGLRPDAAAALRLLRDTGNGLMVLVNDLLDFAKMDEGQLTIVPFDFEVGEALRRCVALFLPRARARGIDLVLDAAPEAHTWAHGDGHRLQQIVANLVSNAVKFTEHGRVTLRARRGGDSLVVEVEDTGIGIADVDRIWQPYEQGDDNIALRFGGTGLGLTIVRDLVLAMSGSIRVRSAPGEGAVFTVRLPMPVISSPDVRRRRDASPGRSLKVLLADDNAVNQLVGRGLLRAAGHVATVVDDGLQALEALERETFDIALIDLHMPGHDGVEVVRAMRARGDMTPTVAVTADAFPETRERCLEAGFDAFLVKPFDARALDEILCVADQRELAPA